MKRSDDKRPGLKLIPLKPEVAVEQAVVPWPTGRWVLLLLFEVLAGVLVYFSAQLLDVSVWMGLVGTLALLAMVLAVVAMVSDVSDRHLSSP